MHLRITRSDASASTDQNSASMSLTTYDHANWYEAERLHRAAENSDIQEIERLILAGYDVSLFDDMTYTPLHHAVLGRSIEAAKVLLRHGAFVNANDFESIGETPLALAVQGEYLELVCLLLESGAAGSGHQTGEHQVIRRSSAFSADASWSWPAMPQPMTSPCLRVSPM